MATIERVTLICDICGRDGDNAGVERHTVTIDGREYEGDICSRDWTRVSRGLAVLTEHIKGRRARRA